MDGQRWIRLQSLFAQALTLSADERGGFYERECGVDVQLRSDLESLVRAHSRAQTHVEDAVLGTLGSILGPEGEARSARRALSRMFERAGRRPSDRRPPARSDSTATRE